MKGTRSIFILLARITAFEMKQWRDRHPDDGAAGISRPIVDLSREH